MTAPTGSWLSAHGRLWYDDPWYRIAWIVWPQAIGLLLFVVLWLAPPGQRVAIPWAKPAVEAPKSPAQDRQVLPTLPQQRAAPPLAQQPADALAPCKTGDNAQIIQACSALLASGSLSSSNIPDAYWRRGWAYYLSKQYQLAMGDYDRAIAINPAIPGFYNDRGLIWIGLGNNDRAMQDFDQAILLKPDFAFPYLNRGIALRNLNRPNEALVALAAAIERDSKLFWAYENRASIYETRADWRATYDDANKMIEIQPNNRLGYEFRGHAYFEVGQYQPAIADFTRAISIDQNQIYSYRLRGRAYYFLSQFDNAMADYEAALRIDANDSTTISYINDLRRRRGGR